MKLYLAVTNDEYEMPIAVCDNATDLAKACGVSKGTIFSEISRNNTSAKAKRKYLRIEVDENEID